MGRGALLDFEWQKGVDLTGKRGKILVECSMRRIKGRSEAIVGIWRAVGGERADSGWER